jgi:hypothetical protein
MKLFTVHAERPASVPVTSARPPVLLAEGFCWGAALFGPLWFAWNRLWWDALVLLLLQVAAALLPEPFSAVAMIGIAVIAGMEARDRLRAQLGRRGLAMQGVVAAPDLDIAWFRLAQTRPDLLRGLR